MDLFLDIENGQSEIRNASPIVTGELIDTQYFYLLRFPGRIDSRTTRWEWRYKINKSTGDFLMIHGITWIGSSGWKEFLYNDLVGQRSASYGRCTKQ